MSSETSGLIFNIQRFSTEDGPGIRTTVFMKGCPMCCLWCHNVEGIDPNPQIIWHDSRCIGCLSCVKACPKQAITSGSEGLETDRNKCDACGTCASVCPARARELVGRRVTVGEALDEILKDRVFYETSGGGVTASGGEPTLQPEFVTNLFTRCGSSGVKTALDTCGYARWEKLRNVLEHTDLVLYDLKLIDSKEHTKCTGVNPDLVWRNARKIADMHKPMWVRTPVVPGYTDSIRNIRGIAEMCEKLGNVERLDLLPYHRLGEPKYKKLGLKYRLAGLQPPGMEAMEKLKQVAREFRIKVVT